jgi:hypothetical protein
MSENAFDEGMKDMFALALLSKVFETQSFSWRQV